MACVVFLPHCMSATPATVTRSLCLPISCRKMQLCVCLSVCLQFKEAIKDVESYNLDDYECLRWLRGVCDQ